MSRKKEDADADEKLLMIRVIQMSYIAQNSLSEVQDIFIFYQLYLIEKGLILQCLAMPLRVRVGNLLLEMTSCEVILS